MAGPLLRSDRLDQFNALGENGQPVYASAQQLREAIRLSAGPQAAGCMAIPQSNETGDRIDWYAPVEGDVIPWTAATQAERDTALQQLEIAQTALQELSEKMRASTSNEQSLFGNLLEKSMQFPDSEHVYLVDGKPVITFWGFVGDGQSTRPEPLGCLRLLKSPIPQPVMAPAAAAPTRRPWWLWLLPLLLLLLLLLLLWWFWWRIPHLPEGSEEIPLPEPAVEQPKNAERDPLGIGIPGVTTSIDGISGIGTGTDNSLAEENAAGEGQQPGKGQEQDESGGDSSKENQQGQENQQGKKDNPQLPPVDPQAENVKKSLKIPADALKNGSTDFLNGNWKVNAGIQDSQTGKPISLDYQLKDGKGTVSLNRGDGVVCSANVGASVNGGGLRLDNGNQAKCNDGSSYKMPQVACKPGAQNVADCTGSYQSGSSFPISMKKGNNG